MMVGGYALTDGNPLYVVCDDKPVYAYFAYTVSSPRH